MKNPKKKKMKQKKANSMVVVRCVFPLTIRNEHAHIKTIWFILVRFIGQSRFLFFVRLFGSYGLAVYECHLCTTLSVVKFDFFFRGAFFYVYALRTHKILSESREDHRISPKQQMEENKQMETHEMRRCVDVVVGRRHRRHFHFIVLYVRKTVTHSWCVSIRSVER